MVDAYCLSELNMLCDCVTCHRYGRYGRCVGANACESSVTVQIKPFTFSDCRSRPHRVALSLWEGFIRNSRCSSLFLFLSLSPSLISVTSHLSTRPPPRSPARSLTSARYTFCHVAYQGQRLQQALQHERVKNGSLLQDSVDRFSINGNASSKRCSTSAFNTTLLELF